jgi:hypothetical protein
MPVSACISKSRLGTPQCATRVNTLRSNSAARRALAVRSNSTEAGSAENAVEEHEIITPDDAEKAMELGLFSTLQLTVSLTLLQVRYNAAVAA